jgi:hypothetical protein
MKLPVFEREEFLCFLEADFKEFEDTECLILSNQVKIVL